MPMVPDNGNVGPVGAGPASDPRKWRLIASLLFRDGCFGAAVSVLSGLADAGDDMAGELLAGLLAQTSRLQLLRRRAYGGDAAATRHLAALAADYGWPDELERLADRDVYAACALASLWSRSGRIEDALRLMRQLSDAGSFPSQVRLATLLAEHGRMAELSRRALAGDWQCALVLVEQFYRRDQPEQALAVLRLATGRTAAGDTWT
jgi:hypothetical protein